MYQRAQSPQREKIVLVYSDDTIASSFFFHVRPRENFRVFGFLPMNLQLDCWLSMLRLLFLGQSCVPTSLLVDPQGIDRGDVSRIQPPHLAIHLT